MRAPPRSAALAERCSRLPNIAPTLGARAGARGTMNKGSDILPKKSALARLRRVTLGKDKVVPAVIFHRELASSPFPLQHGILPVTRARNST